MRKLELGKGLLTGSLPPEFAEPQLTLEEIHARQFRNSTKRFPASREEALHHHVVRFPSEEERQAGLTAILHQYAYDRFHAINVSDIPRERGIPHPSGYKDFKTYRQAYVTTANAAYARYVKSLGKK